MKLQTLIFIALSSQIESKVFEKNSESHEISQAISDVARGLFTLNHLKFDVIVLGNVTSHIKEVVDSLRFDSEVLQISSSKVACELIYNRAAVIITETVETLNSLELLLCFNNYERIQGFAIDLRFLVYVERPFNEFDLAITMPDSEFGDFCHFSYYLMKSGSEISLKTLEWWTASACYKPQMVLLNRFDGKGSTWLSPIGKIEKKFKNFHNCTLKTHSDIFQVS